VNESIRIVELDGRRLTLLNLDRVLWPDDGYTKLDLIAYYTDMSEYLLPCLADRPVGVVRLPDGPSGESTYHTAALPGLPSWIPVRRIRVAAPAGYLQSLVGVDRPSLVYLVNLGCISFHPWSATVSVAECPCELRFDLDAVELPFREVRGAALLMRELLAAQGLQSWVKTSGGHGLHVMVPLLGKEPFDRVMTFASAIARQALAREPSLFTLDVRRNRRRDRILVDIHRNDPGATLVSAYSVRERRGAPVSMPIEWAEVERDISPEDFHIRNARERVRMIGDPFADFFRSPQKLELPSDANASRRTHGGGKGWQG
jgi:bifunctional non-homologous end joining protein LigD